MRTTTAFRELPFQPKGYYIIVGVCAALAVAGFFAGEYIHSAGHHVTGMTNRIVWGMPHVFSIFMILCAAGALTAASVAAVLDRSVYKPLARFSCVTAFAFLAGGLSVLTLDLGQPGHLLPSLSTLNFKSIFSWNLFVYSGFFVLVAVQLWMLMEYRFERFIKPVGTVAFFWRILLATDIGSVFGVVIARPGYDSAVMAPLFVAVSFAVGLAVFLILLIYGYGASGRPLGEAVLKRLGRLLGMFVAAVLFLVVVQHFTASYSVGRDGFETFILRSGGIYPVLFWGVQIVAGGLVPMYLVFSNAMAVKARVLTASVLVAVGGFAQLYVIIIGGQAFPTPMFPGMEVTSSYMDGQIVSYSPGFSEILLGLGGLAFALLLIALAVKVLPVFPSSLADSEVDPHHSQ